MGSLMYTGVALAILAVAGAVQTPDISLLPTGGISFSHPDEPGMSLFAVHYSINKPVPGVAAAEHNVDVRSKTGNVWIHTNNKVKVSPGDTVNYWVLVVSSSGGEQLTDQSWIARGPTTTSTTTTTTTTTTRPPPTDPPTPPPPTTPPPTLGPGETWPPTTTQPTPKPTTPGAVPPTLPSPSGCTSYPCLVFNDEFDRLDFNKWEHEITAGGGGNWEFQYYLNNRSNSYVRDGVLYIKPTLTSERYGEPFLSSGVLEIWGNGPASLCTGPMWYGCRRAGTPTNYVNPIQSARLRTVKSFNVRYGKVEVVAQTPKGDWIWPAIWMLPKHEEYGLWPASGEIDIMESRGNEDLRNEKGEIRGHQHMGSALHWGPYFEANRYELTNKYKEGDFADRFHTYTVEWDETSMKISVDGDVVLNVEPPAGGFWELGDFKGKLRDEANPWVGADNVRMAPFDKEFFIILNVAVGGTNGFFGDNWRNGRGAKSWNNKSPTGPRDFWNGRNMWYPTWNAKENNGEGAAMKVKSVKVWKLKDN